MCINSIIRWLIKMSGKHTVPLLRQLYLLLTVNCSIFFVFFLKVWWKNISKVFTPIGNIMDVSVLGGWCSTVPPERSNFLTVGAHLEMPRGMLGLGLCPGEQKHWAKGPHRGKALSSTVGFSDWARNYQVAGKHPFLCVKDVSLIWGEIVPSEH